MVLFSAESAGPLRTSAAEGFWHTDVNKAFLEPAVVAVKVFFDSLEGVAENFSHTDVGKAFFF
jgi:hypothetical protein